MKKLISRRIVQPLQKAMKQGLESYELAVTLIIGIVIATFPMFGVTTVLCALAASALKLNQVVIQVANYIGYPLQFALFIPLIHLGETVFGLNPVTIDFGEVGSLLQSEPIQCMKDYGTALGAACVIWALMAMPILLLNKLLLTWLKTRKSLGDAA